MRATRIAVLTDHPDPRLIVLAYSLDDAAGASLVSTGHVELHDRYARNAEFVMDVLIDPAGEVAVVSCYAGKLKVVQFEDGKITNSFDVSCVL